MSWLPKQSVVVPSDLSDFSRTAIDQGLQLVADPARLHVIHVLSTIAPTDVGMIWDRVDDEGCIAAAENSLREHLADPHYRGITLKVSIGDPGHTIVEYAAHVGADLIVIPSHGRGGITRLLLGSVTERVVRLAECPVLVLKPARQ